MWCWDPRQSDEAIAIISITVCLGTKEEPLGYSECNMLIHSVWSQPLDWKIDQRPGFNRQSGDQWSLTQRADAMQYWPSNQGKNQWSRFNPQSMIGNPRCQGKCECNSDVTIKGWTQWDYRPDSIKLEVQFLFYFLCYPVYLELLANPPMRCNIPTKRRPNQRLRQISWNLRSGF